MALVVNRGTRQVIRSANTPDFPSQDWLINPDLSGVSGLPTKYWKIVGDSVQAMSQPERDAADAAEFFASEAADRVNEKQRFNEKALRAIVLLLIDEINLLRAQLALPERTPRQARTAFENKVDTI